MSLALVLPFHFLFQIGHVGLALATASSAALNAFWLMTGLKGSGMYRPDPGWRRFLILLATASCLMGGSLQFCLFFLPEFSQWAWWMRILHLTWLCLVGFAVYGFVLHLGGWRVHQLRPDFARNKQP